MTSWLDVPVLDIAIIDKTAIALRLQDQTVVDLHTGQSLADAPITVDNPTNVWDNTLDKYLSSDEVTIIEDARDEAEDRVSELRDELESIQQQLDCIVDDMVDDRDYDAPPSVLDELDQIQKDIKRALR